MSNNSLLDKLETIQFRFEEVATLITDPETIADQRRYVKLTKEYKDLEIALGKYNTQLKNSSAHANKFASALGVNQMSMNQLKAYTKKLRNEMNSLHKESEQDSGC